MKNLTRLLLATAAIILTTTIQSRAASQVVVPLDGHIIKSGSTILVTSGTGDTIDRSPIYSYSLSGSVTGVGEFAPLVSSTIALSGGFDAFGDKVGAVPLSAYLAGTLADPGAKLPFVPLDKFAHGKVTGFTFPLIVRSGTTLVTTTGTGTLLGTVRVIAGIGGRGVVKAEITNVTYVLVVPKKGYLRVTGSSGVIITSGSLVVTTVPAITGTGGTDLSYVTPTGLVGVGITGTDPSQETLGPVTIKKGKTATLTGILENTGTGIDAYTVTAPALPAATGTIPGFVQHIYIGGKDVTAKVTGTTGGYSTKSLDSQGTLGVKWLITDHKLSVSSTAAQVLTVTSKGNGAKDVLGFTVVSGT